MTTTTTTTEEDQILKRDRLGRVKTPRDRREALLAEFDRSGLSGAQFAKWAGIKYGTFITWVQRRKRQAETNPVQAQPVAAAPAAEVRWVEAVRDEVPEKKPPAPAAPATMVVRGPGGVRLELCEERHVLWAAKLLRHLEVPGPC